LGSAIDLLFSRITSPFCRPRRLGKLPDFLRFTAGYVAAWLRDEAFQQETRKMILDHVTKFEPTVILAHSLGSILAYDALAHKDARRSQEVLQKTRFVTLGSQIANGLVVSNLMQGRITRLAVHRWVHLYNELDRVFTAPISLPGAENFLQLRTTFDAQDGLNHRAPMYLSHPATATGLWRTLVRGEDDLPTRIFGTRGLASDTLAAQEPVRKALLVGINDYPNPEQRLEGCINDVYTMSASCRNAATSPGKSAFA
jgi:metacaspase-1